MRAKTARSGSAGAVVAATSSNNYYFGCRIRIAQNCSIMQQDARRVGGSPGEVGTQVVVVGRSALRVYLGTFSTSQPAFSNSADDSNTFINTLHDQLHKYRVCQ
eukprot:6993799-Pyramimonas_sp.AAC.1